ncbi:hypothetical protein BLNAU_22860 [Blattamonas nauphoetae]|uniref:Uncharacterized protein n=1 Tax=Blattamonas nauphoetae TaxID=2049346 RepID=A0ABQ9WRV0_9EUKA|nr:hypothetical protein BLNAU_22860 [Blattamonas nauphoetae]
MSITVRFDIIQYNNEQDHHLINQPSRQLCLHLPTTRKDEISSQETKFFDALESYFSFNHIISVRSMLSGLIYMKILLLNIAPLSHMDREDSSFHHLHNLQKCCGEHHDELAHILTLFTFASSPDERETVKMDMSVLIKRMSRQYRHSRQSGCTVCTAMIQLVKEESADFETSVTACTGNLITITPSRPVFTCTLVVLHPPRHSHSIFGQCPVGGAGRTSD